MLDEPGWNNNIFTSQCSKLAMLIEGNWKLGLMSIQKGQHNETKLNNVQYEIFYIPYQVSTLHLKDLYITKTPKVHH